MSWDFPQGPSIELNIDTQQAVGSPIQQDSEAPLHVQMPEAWGISGSHIPV